MLTLTDTANHTVDRLVEAASDSTTAGLRIAVRDDVSYGVEIVQEAEPGDVVLEGARVYLDPVVAESLSEAVLDATEDGKLVIARRP